MRMWLGDVLSVETAVEALSVVMPNEGDQEQSVACGCNGRWWSRDERTPNENSSVSSLMSLLGRQMSKMMMGGHNVDKAQH